MSGKPTSVLHGAMLMVGMRWVDRLIGLMSTLILARLLVPEDLGIIAMSSLVVGLADMLLDLGVEAALIRNREATREHYDSAWTLRLLQMCLSAGLVVLCAPLAAAYFQEPRVEPVLQVTALSLVLGGLQNIGIVNFQKEMRFREDFRFTFLRRIVGFAATMILAWVLRSYWALVIGALAGRLFGLLLSYTMHPMRPRLHWSKVREIFGFSQWMLVRGIGLYLDATLHRFFVGGRSGSAVMGGYSLANDIAAMPSSELLMPLNRVLFPALVDAKHDLSELARKFLLAQGVQVVFALPASVGLALVAHDAVPVLLGEKWVFAVPFVQLLALVHAARALTSSSSFLLLTLGRPRQAATLAWFQVLVFTVPAMTIWASGGATEMAISRILAAVFGVGLAGVLVHRALPAVGYVAMLGTAIRPAVAITAMIAVVSALRDFTEPLGHLLSMLVLVNCGAITYAIVLLVLWWAGGRPLSAERYLIENFARPMLLRLRGRL